MQMNTFMVRQQQNVTIFAYLMQSEEKKLQFLVTSNIFGLKSRDSRAFSEKSREK